MRLVFCKISSTSSSKIIVPWTPENVLTRGLTKYKFIWGSSHCSMKSGVELIYRSINSSHITYMGHVKVSYKVVVFLGSDMLLLT